MVRRGTDVTTRGRPGAPNAPLPVSGLRLRPVAWAVVAAVLIAAAAVNAWLHPVPLYATETDLVGDYVPTARALASLRIEPADFETKGPGYPLLLALGAPLAGHDYFVAAKGINCFAAAGVALLAFVAFAGVAGEAVGLVVLVGLALNPTFWRAAIEAGTDLPAMALALGASCFLIRGRRASAAVFAGFLAGLAVLTRTNYVCLGIAGAGYLATCSDRRRWLVPFAAGLAIPLVAWGGVCLDLMGRLPRDTNYLNVAYGLYGRGHTWEDFLTRDAGAFRSYADVVRLDPATALRGLAWNAFDHAWRDVSQLLPLPIGLMAAIGIVWRWRRERSRAFLGWCLGSAFAVLVPVFYAPRFALFELPFLLAAAGSVLVAAVRWSGGRGRPGLAAAAAVTLGCGTFSAALAVRDAAGLLRDPPVETRDVGRQLRAQHAEGLVMARKPHVAYYADLAYVPLPRARSLTDLIYVAARNRIAYVFVSSREATLRPEYELLARSGLALPGLRPVAFASAAGVRAAAYRVEPPLVPIERERLGVAAALDSLPVSGASELAIGTELLYAGAFTEALRHLERAQADRPRDADIAGMETNALHALHRYDEAAEACLRAIALGGGSVERYSELGRIRYLQGRYADAVPAFRQAIAMNAADGGDHYLLGLAYFEQRQYGAAAEEFAAFRRFAPAASGAVRMEALSRARAGDVAGALAVIGRAGAGSSPGLEALADSLRAARHQP